MRLHFAHHYGFHRLFVIAGLSLADGRMRP
ncbi:UNVERIFIED_ORG: hypothetical protein J2W85_005923 [Ensifer adhaerens]|nr:hypothetical protein [Ensifer adhaerens]